jgi:hypothetical protein
MGEGGRRDQRRDGLVLMDAADGDLLPGDRDYAVLLARRCSQTGPAEGRRGSPAGRMPDGNHRYARRGDSA